MLLMCLMLLMRLMLLMLRYLIKISEGVPKLCGELIYQRFCKRECLFDKSNAFADEWFHHLGESENIFFALAEEWFHHLGESEEFFFALADEWFHHLGESEKFT